MMRDLCRVTSRDRTEKEREMAWVVRARAWVLAQEAKRTVFQRGRHTAQMRSASPCVFCSWSRSFSLEANYPEILVQPAGCFFHFLSLTGQSPRCVSDGGGEAKSRVLVSRLLETNLMFIAKWATLEKSLSVAMPPFPHL